MMGKPATHSASTNTAAILEAVADALRQGARPGETDDFGADALMDAAQFVADAAVARRPGAPLIRLESRSRDDTADHRMGLRLAIINDDMPFLVDSIAGAIDRHGVAIGRIIHPVVAVRRSADGVLERLAYERGTGERLESMIYMELARADARTRKALVAELEASLADVRAAVADWLKLQAALQQDIDLVSDEEGAALLRWFLDRNLTLLGHHQVERDGRIVAAQGIARHSAETILPKETAQAAFRWFETGGRVPLILKSGMIARVHRRVLIDLILVPHYGDAGLSALSVHAALWTSGALSAPPNKVPVLRSRLAGLIEKFAFDPSGHAGKALIHALTALPHDILIAIDTATLEQLALTAMSITDRPRPKIVMAQGALEQHIFAFVWLPRDEVSTGRRIAIEAMLRQAAGAPVIGWSIALEDGGPALLRYTLDLSGGGQMPDPDALDSALELMVRGWLPEVEAELDSLGEGSRSAVLASRYAPLFPAAYRSTYTPAEAARDIRALKSLEGAHGRAARLFARSHDDGTQLRLKIYAADGAVHLSDAVPVLENFGFAVIEEVPTELDGADPLFIHDFLLVPSSQISADDLIGHAERIEAAVAAVLTGTAENDPFNQLVIAAGLSLSEIGWFRAWFRYLRQTGMAYGIPTVVNALRSAPAISRSLIALFRALHDPAARDEAAAADARAMISAGLTQISAIDDDRILRTIMAVISATLRTNAFAPSAGEALAFKLDSAKVPGLPAPLPWREVFVYSERVEGIHLRAGPVARGGLRWSDRRDDFRTEILGLMKAQRVKNAVIVPTGAKGGFYPKKLPDPAAGRDAWLAEGTESYRIFIRTLLSITDNIVGGAVVHPEGVIVHDGDDPYFVVAADKGTATFSDIANAIALERNFWLGDAFASGGGNGYDHKAMGITAKGAWISVQRHFAEMGIDVQRQPIRVAGVGDMSGDVFGNGMLLSKAIKLVAAFDHRHIFLDPEPDPEASWAERARLFALPRSSWDDYDRQALSPGGGVFARSLKAIPLSPQVQAMLGLEAGEIEPSALMSAILRAQVDLIWFGGIGTYVKASAQNNAEVGDPGNDAIRISAGELRAKAIGEGANLGVTQAARIEFAALGGRINTDFIDNSAGVDCSDNEVNIKIALAHDVAAGTLTLDARNRLLERMTPAVAELVLEDNRLQTLALSIAEGGGARAMPSLLRLMETFEAQGRLDRRVEGLAGNDIYLRRANEGAGLTRPELAVLLSTAKLALQDAAEDSALGADPLLEDELLAAFPPHMAKAHRDAILAHRLRPQIIATKVANRIINRMGLVHPFELAEEEGVALGAVAEAFVVAEALFDVPALWDKVDAAAIDEAARLLLFEQIAIELRAHMADLLRNAVHGRSLAQCVADLRPGLNELARQRTKLLPDELRTQSRAFANRLAAAGVPEPLAEPVVRLAELDGAIGLIAFATRLSVTPIALTRAFTRLGSALRLDWAQGMAMHLNPTDPWERLLAAGLARDFHQMRLVFLARLDDKGDPSDELDAWLRENAPLVGQFQAMVDRARVNPLPSTAMLAQIAGQARTLLSR